METRFSKINQENVQPLYRSVEKPKFSSHQGRKQVEGFYTACFYWIYRMGEGSHNKTALGEPFGFTLKYGHGGSTMIRGVNI